MNDALIFFFMICWVIFMLGIMTFKEDKKFAIGVFFYLITLVGFTLLILFDEYYWAVLIFVIQATVLYPTNADKISRWISNRIL